MTGVPSVPLVLFCPFRANALEIHRELFTIASVMNSRFPTRSRNRDFCLKVIQAKPRITDEMPQFCGRFAALGACVALVLGCAGCQTFQTPREEEGKEELCPAADRALDVVGYGLYWAAPFFCH